MDAVKRGPKREMELDKVPDRVNMQTFKVPKKLQKTERGL